MNEELREALEAACSVDAPTMLGRTRHASFATLRARIVDFLRNAPDDMSVRELRDELES